MSIFDRYRAIREEIDDTKNFEGSLVGVTVRLPQSLIDKLDYVKESTNQTRQAVLLDLLSESIEAALLGVAKAEGMNDETILQFMSQFQPSLDTCHPDAIAFLQALVHQKRMTQEVASDWISGDFTILEMIEKHDLSQENINMLTFADEKYGSAK